MCRALCESSDICVVVSFHLGCSLCRQ